MSVLLDLPVELAPVQAHVARGLGRVDERLRSVLTSDLEPVQRLCRHVERYHGKMLRPSLVMLAALASRPEGGAPIPELPAPDVIDVATVCEMIHVATLVHDDVLDEADTRRGARTVNDLTNNESAVILGDFIFSTAYRLCSRLGTPVTAEEIATAGMTLCEGELLQNHHHGDWSLSEPTYFQIVERKTGSLVAVACALGARHAGAEPGVVEALRAFGLDLGVAFQIQDDLLDLTGDQRVVGKSLGKDVEKGKLTLPMIHHLRVCDEDRRRDAVRLLEDASRPGVERARDLARALHASGSVAYALEIARRLVARARASLEALPPSPARRVLGLLGEAVITRTS